MAGLLTDVVKEQMAEAVVDGPQPVIISRAYSGGDRRRFCVEFPIRPEGFGQQIPNRPRHPRAEVHAIGHVVDGNFRGRLVAPHPSPDAARFFAVASRHGVHAAAKSQ